MTSMSPPTRSPSWQQAASLAARAHRHQLRKDNRTPYVAHPMRVTLTVACLFGVTDETVLTAALLHDAIEDTTVDYDDLLHRFGAEVADTVAALSKDKRRIEPEREAAYDEQLARAPWPARLIKLADVYDNLADADNPGSQRSLCEKVRRALAIAENDEQLDAARAIVGDLLDAVEADLAAHHRE